MASENMIASLKKFNLIETKSNAFFMANLENVRAISTGKGFWDIYEVSYNLTIWNYIGQIHVDPWSFDVIDVIKGHEQVLELESRIVFRDGHTKYCYRIRFGDSK